mgnify:CR=1 FL=1
MLWLMTMGRRLNGVYAAFMLVAFMMGVAGALQAPTLSLFLSREVGAQPFWVGLFYTVNAIAGILVSLWLAKRSDSRGDRRRLIMFCCLMAVLVGFSVLIPYIGAFVVTIPVIGVALFQFGAGTEFWSCFAVYLIIQGLDGNLLVPLLFSEAVNLHPLVIILSVIIFGGLWGFWGVFFAIPLATLVQAVIHAWPDTVAVDDHHV